MGSLSPEVASSANGVADAMEPMAIIGMAARFPQQADNSENLWKFLLQARQAMTKFPGDRINMDGHYHPDMEHGGTFHVKGGHFLAEHPAYFDAPFFSVTKSEVMTLDPQQRIIMENTYHALENAGIPMSQATSTFTSVFVSGFNTDHLGILNTDPETSLKYKPTGCSNSILANRVSWFYDFKAPSLSIDTACSSSMVALHLACQSLRAGESDMSVVSGVNMLAFPTDIFGMSHHGFLSPEGKCFSFDHRADGYSRGEGVGSLIVKRLSDALRDGNTIRAVIRGTGVNQDGRTAGITLPSSSAQESLMRQVYGNAGLDFKDTRMVEAHGTGTAAGDPIEASAIASTFRPTKASPLYIGAIKSGIGHLEGGSGVAGVIKSILILESGIIPPNVNFEKVNPKIPMDKWNIRFPVENTPWPSEGLRRISVNSFGVGGTNAHTILDDAYSFLTSRELHGIHTTSPNVPSIDEIRHIVDELKRTSEEVSVIKANAKDVTMQNGFHDNTPNGSTKLQTGASQNRPVQNGVLQDGGLQNGVSHNGVSQEAVLHNGVSENGTHSNGIVSNGNSHDENDPIPEDVTPRIFVLSSFDEEGVKRNAKRYSKYFKTTTPVKRKTESQYLDDLAYTLSNRRSIFPWRSYCLASSVEQLAENFSNDHGVSKPMRVRNTPKIGFIFTGQGAQWYAMGRELLVYPIFKSSLQNASEYMKSLGAPWSLIEELLQTKVDTRVNSPSLAHPSCAALQIALVDLLSSWNILPNRVAGHSSGEIAAAYAAGKLSREAAWKVAYYRGVVSAKQSGSRGAMIAVGLSAASLQPYMEKVDSQFAGEMIIACFNGPKNVTVSGDNAKIDALKTLLDGDNIFARKLNVSNAYHSAHMQEVADDYLKAMGDVSTGERLLTIHDTHMFSSVTGHKVDQSTLNAQYWVDNMVSPVRFTEALTEMCYNRLSKGQASLRLNASSDAVVDIILEIGPHGALRSAIKETLATQVNGSSISYHPVLDRSNPGLNTILSTAGSLGAKGYFVNTLAVNQASKRLAKTPKLLVKLPPYSFNHSEMVLYESRLSKNFRQRKFPRHDLFGAPSSDWNADAPKWRHFVRLAENPWLRDHVVTDSFVYPGVGYIIMAIEGCRQMADEMLKITGFRLRDISMKRALIIPDTKEGVETSLTMSRMDESSLWGSSTWKKFHISSYNPTGDDWIEHCTGYIAVDYDASSGPIDNGREAEAEARRWQQSLHGVTERCQTPMDIEGIYDNLITAGLKFGPMFRNLSNVQGGGQGVGEITSVVTVPDVAQSMPKNYMHSHLIHPCTMDSMFHLFLLSVLDLTGKTTLESAIVPTFVKDIWISADVISKPATTFRGYGKSSQIAYEKYESDIMIWDAVRDEGLISIKGLKATPLQTAASGSGQRRNFCHNIDWKQDSELSTPSSFSSVVLSSKADDKIYRHWINRFQLAVMLRVTDALDELKGFDADDLEGHFRRYWNWLNFKAETLQNDAITHLSLEEWKEYANNSTLKEELYREVDEHNADGALAMRMGSYITSVLKKEVDPLHLMFGDDLMNRVYDEAVGLGDIPNYQKAYLKTVGHNSTNLNILEVGAGTGSSTAVLFEILSPIAGEGESAAASKISRYTFTDISPGFFEKAKERFKDWADVLDFKTFDAEKDPSNQGFEVGSYDFVVAGNVVHATSDLRKTLAHIQSLLKPGGKLILQEGIRQDFLWSPLAFGQLPGWWQGVEPIRKWSPWIPLREWDIILRDAGFSGIDLNLADRQDADLHTQSLIIATATNPNSGARKAPEKVYLITSSHSQVSAQNDLKAAIQRQLSERYGKTDCSVIHYMDLVKTDLTSSVCISLLELEQSLLVEMSEEEYLNIRSLLSTPDGLLWVTGDVTARPELNMITGMIRSVRWERDVDEANIVPLSISDPLPSTEVIAQSIVKLFDHQFIDAPVKKRNAEYLFRDGLFLSSRLTEAPQANNFLNSNFLKAAPKMQTLGSAGRPVKLSTSAPGMLDKLEFVTDSVYYEPLDNGIVEIEIKAVGLNFRDVMIAMGEHMAYSMGNEAAGVITRVGCGVTNLNVGDRVVFMCGFESVGCFHTYGRVQWQNVVRIPNSLSFEIACGLPCVYATAIYGLYDIARLSEGETILIHAAAGGVGQAAIQLAKLVGAEVFATVSTPEKRALLVEEYGIPEDHIFSSRNLTFEQGVMRMTRGKGVDVLLNSLSGDALRRSWECMAPFGRFIEIGKKDAQASGKIELNPFLRQMTMASVELPMMNKHKPMLLRRLIEDTVRLYDEGKIREAKPTTVMSYEKIEEGLRLLQSGRGMGKMVFKPSDEDIVPIVPEMSAPYKLKENATYILAGGLGGIGRSLGRWMATRGAKNLVFLSRTGKVTEPVDEMIKDLESKGCQARIFACNVSDKARLAAVVEECRKSMPPIRGVIQGSMVLKDIMFENMSYEDFRSVVNPKVQGSWNLHDQLPKDMDFFVMLSSATGVLGNRSQANYAAGNTYQDALARHRIANGLPAASVDLGTVLSVGYVAEHKETTKALATVLEVVREDEIHTIIEYLIDPRSSLNDKTCQLVVGVTDANFFRQRGIPPMTYLSYPLFTHLNTQSTSRSHNSEDDPMLMVQAQLGVATSMEEAAGIIATGIRNKLSLLLAIPVDNIDAAKSISSNGVDSLVAMEFRTWLAKDLAADIPLLDIMGTSSITAVSQKAAAISKLVHVEPAKVG